MLPLFKLSRILTRSSYKKAQYLYLLTGIRSVPTIKHSNMADIFNTSSAQSELLQKWHSSTSQPQGALLGLAPGWSIWQYVVAFLLGVVLYDQGNQEYWAMGCFLLLTPSLVMYIKRKGSIAGPPLKIPLMGPFLQAIHPKFESYLAQWASGPLSCVSIFHKYVSVYGYLCS